MRKVMILFLCLGLTLFASCESLTAEQEALVQQAVTANLSYDDNDYYNDWADGEYNTISLNGDTASADSTTVVNGRMQITDAGTYVISGTMTNGGITVDAGKEDIVQLVLNGADIHSEGEPAIYVKGAKKTIITVAGGTNNVLSDSESYNYDESDTDAPTATLFSKDDLTINGSGSLTINASYNDAVTSKDNLKILGTTIIVNSTDDAIIGRDSVCIKYGSFTINAGGDAIKSTNDENADKGFVAIEDGVFSITAGADAIQAETNLFIYGGQYEIITGGGSDAAVTSKQPAYGNMGENGMGQGGMKRPGDMTTPNATQDGSRPTPPDATTQATPQVPPEGMGGITRGDMPNDTASGTDDSSDVSGKGLKAANSVNVLGGQITIDSLDDAIHSNNIIYISSGVIYIKAGDDAIHADSVLTIDGGTITAEKCYEGLESANITVNNGIINITASDDGVNATEGTTTTANDMNQQGGRANMGRGNAVLTINGGEIYVSAQGDGLDANGSIYQNGGLTVINGPTSGGNGALDYDGEYVVSGGTIIAAGSSQMNMAPSASGQNSVSMTFSQTQQANSTVCITDETGKVLAAFAPLKNYQSVVFSSADIQADKTYTISTGGTVNDNNTAGYSANATSTGNAIVSFTAQSGVTYVNESGVTTGGNGMGGAMNRGQGGKGNADGTMPSGGRGGMRGQQAPTQQSVQ